MSGFRDLLALVLGWKSSEAADLASEQKSLGGDPVVTLTIGAHSLDAFVWGYRYEEKADSDGALTVWLLNKGDEFDDLSTDYPDLKRGAAVDLRRGLPVGGVDTTEKLPRTWVEGFRYVYVEGTPLLELQCIDWRERMAKFRYAAEQNWSSTEIATICGSILGQVGLTLASGSFGFSIDFTASPRRAGNQILVDLMRRVDEYLYAGLDGEIQHKELDPSEAASYSYDWSDGSGSNHPLMQGTQVAETSPKYNKVVVNDGTGTYTGSAQDSDEITLVGTRLRTLTDRELTSNAQCTERARAELRFWLAQTVTGVIVARPHFTLRMYDVVSIAAPPWGGPAVTGRVRRIVEEYGRGRGLWQQVIEVGGLAGKQMNAADLSDGAIDGDHIIEGAITADEIAAGTVTASELASGSVTADKINVSTLSAIAADMGTLTAGTIKMGTGTKDSDLTGFQIDSSELVGQNSGVDQVVLASGTGKITAGAGAVVLDADGIHSTSGTSDVNKLKVMDGSDVILAAYAEIEAGVGATGLLESVGKNADNPEGTLELIAKTYDGAAHSGLSSLSMTLETETGVADLSATRLRLNTTYLELTEQSGDPDAPGANRGRLYLKDNGSGKTQLCIRFNTGAVQVIATEP